jgi:hypothetical protein
MDLQVAARLVLLLSASIVLTLLMCVLGVTMLLQLVPA